MTTQNPTEGQPHSAQYTMTDDGLVGIVRAGRSKATGVGEERGNQELILPNAAQDQPAQKSYDPRRRVGLLTGSGALPPGSRLRRLPLRHAPPTRRSYR